MVRTTFGEDDPGTGVDSTLNTENARQSRERYFPPLFFMQTPVIRQKSPM